MTTPFERLVADLATEQQQIDTRAVLSKALTAQQQGLLTATDVAMIEAAANRGMPMPEELTKAVSAVDSMKEHRKAEHEAGDERIAAAALDGAIVSMPRAKLDKLIEAAQRAGRLRPGDAARAEAAVNLNKPIPRDVLARLTA